MNLSRRPGCLCRCNRIPPRRVDGNRCRYRLELVPASLMIATTRHNFGPYLRQHNVHFPSRKSRPVYPGQSLSATNSAAKYRCRRREVLNFRLIGLGFGPIKQRRDRGLRDSSSARRVTNQTHTSRTDPDATLAQKKGTPRQLKYKVHQSIDADSRVILDTEVTTGARHDNQPYLGQLQRIQKKYKITIRAATADRGYGSAAIIRSLQEAGITTYIPLWSGRVGNSKYLKGKLVYDKKRDRFRCPRGKYLTPNPAICANQKRYVSSSVDCRHCPQRPICPTEANKKLPYKRYVRRSLDQDLFEEVQARMEEPEFRKKLSERMWKAEGLFAEAKQNHGLSCARYRGRSKVQIQAYLSAMAQNLKRLVFLFYYWLVTWKICWQKIAALPPSQPISSQTFSTGPVVFQDCRETDELMGL